MNENLNLVELLKDVPKGTEFYCRVCGDVTFDRICYSYDDYPIGLIAKNGEETYVTIDGKWDTAHSDGECVFFPSKTQHDWSIWEKEQEAKKQLLPVDTPVMVCFFMDGRIIEDWRLRCYAGGNKCFDRGYKSTDEVDANTWDVIIPFDKFNPNNIEESLKHNIVKS